VLEAESPEFILLSELLEFNFLFFNHI